MHKIQEQILNLMSGGKIISRMTLRQIGKEIGEKFPQKIAHHLNELQKKGMIKINKKTKEIKKSFGNISQNSPLMAVPIVGIANCGPATIFANENIEGYLRISKKILKKCKNIFAIKAQGLSMNMARVEGKTIEDGDYLIIDSEYKSPRNGDIILSIIDDMANIKKYIWDDFNNQVLLVSESTKDIPPIFIHQDDSFVINGKVIQVIKRPKLA